MFVTSLKILVILNSIWLFFL